MAKIPIGLQLYSIREDCKKDLPGVLKAVAKMGYDGVEFAGYYNYSAKDLRKMLDDLGLKCCGTHTGLNTVAGDELNKTIDFNKELGNAYLIVPWIAEEKRNSKQAWLDTAKQFNEIADKLKPHGMLTGYHNHHVEFTPIDGGQTGWDLFFSSTRPEVVMQLDTGNALHGGAESPPILRKFPGRAVTVHLKEFAKNNDKVLVGEGDVDWKAVFDACESVGGTKWYIVEQESYAHPPMECVDKCLQNLRKMGK